MEKKKKGKKGYTVVMSNDVKKGIERMPRVPKKELLKVMEGFMSGEIDPMEVGKSVNFEKLTPGLRCRKCGAKEVEWLIDRSDGEVTYRCRICGEHAWMWEREYEEAVKKNPELVLHEGSEESG